MKGQPRHILAVMPLASVSLGIIPFTAQRTVWPLEAFYLHDDFGRLDRLEAAPAIRAV